MRKLLTYPELNDRGVPLCRRQIDRLECEGKFPRRVAISERRVGWVATEIDEYVERAIANRSTEIGTLGSSQAEALRLGLINS
jgi:prophage regulatory protein